MVIIKQKDGTYREAHGVIKGYEDDKWWLINFPWSNACCFNILVQADNEQDVIDAIADSDEFYRWISADEDFQNEFPDEVSYHGNDGKPCDLSNVMKDHLNQVKAENIEWDYQGKLYSDGSKWED